MTERAAGRKNTTQFVFAENSLDILRLFAALQIAITHYLNLTMLHMLHELLESAFLSAR